MQVVIHPGIHGTDSDKLLKTVLRNVEDFRRDGIAVPGPGKYRKLLSEMLNALDDSAPAPGAREVFLDNILDEDPDQIDRLILSHENLFSVPKIALSGARPYRKAERRLLALQQIFEEDELELFLAIRNPATYLPTVYRNTPHAAFDEFLAGVDPMQLRWSDFVERIADAVPGMPITLWCDEDSPLIWGQLVREIAGVEFGREIKGAFARLGEITSKEGLQRFRSFLEKNPGMTEIQVRRAMVAFLDKYAIDELLEEELDLPGWTEDYVQTLTDIYEDDLYEIARIPGVTLITP